MKNKNFWVLLFTVLVLFTHSVWAFQPKDKAKKKHHKAMRKEIRSYMKANVLPVLKEQRSQLEAKLSEADKQQVADLRGQLKGLKKEQKTMRKSLKAMHEKGQIDETQLKQFDAIRQQMRTIMGNSQKIALKYDKEIEALLNNLEPQKNKWKADIQAIRQKHIQKDSASTGNFRRMLKSRHLQLWKQFKPAGFLLLPPDKDIIASETDGDKDETAKVYPNPTTATSQNTIEFKVKEAGNVTIVLVDAQGTVLKTILSEHKAKGKHQVTFDLEALKDVVYFYKITTPDKTEVKKIMVK